MAFKFSQLLCYSGRGFSSAYEEFSHVSKETGQCFYQPINLERHVGLCGTENQTLIACNWGSITKMWR